MQSFLNVMRKNKWLLAMAAPGALFLLIYAYTPMLGLVIAFKRYRFDEGIFGSKWVGFQNFEFLFATRDAWRITLNTLYLNALFIVIGTVSSLIVALLLNEVRKKGLLKFYQSALFFPYFLSWVIVGYFTFALLNYDSGMINKLLESFGFSKIQWYAKPNYWPFILIIVYVWKNIGYFSVIYLASMMGIGHEYYEAAKIDGANKWQQITKITIPLLTPVITIMTLLQIGRIFYADFGLFYHVPQNTGMLYETTDVIDTYVFRSLRMLGDVGMASAAGFYQAVVGLVLVLLSNWIVRRINPDNALF
ncbi:sugar ABC transporter permease [Paenibacillus pectinilyticus]|uniref:Sugar ABC transporter permease n=2 Tax=Paenibacillus pectinilyticus TaxID=512399 RepID=A0A1C0ZRW0_9BACL|nr:sugar ABC transporter permease [Paenibacillus pectinilyticus]